MDKQKRKYELYHVVLMYLTGKVTENMRKLYLDIDFDTDRMMLTAFYRTQPTDLELELLDDIVTNSNAPIPDLYVDAQVKLMHEYDEDEKHDYLIFAFFDEARYDYPG